MMSDDILGVLNKIYDSMSGDTDKYSEEEKAKICKIAAMIGASDAFNDKNHEKCNQDTLLITSAKDKVADKELEQLCEQAKLPNDKINKILGNYDWHSAAFRTYLSEALYDIDKKKEAELRAARALRKTLIGASWEREALEAYDKACKLTDELSKE